MAWQVAAILRLFMFWLLTASLTACSASIRLMATAGPVPPAEAPPVEDWRVLEPGLSWRTIVPHGDELAQLNVLRIDPARFRFRAVYRPGEPLSLAGWQAQETDAIALINANFFDTQSRALGMVISDGQKHGVPYYDRGGTLLVSGDDISIRSFRQGYVTVDDTIDQAVQGFPMLVEAGKQVFFQRIYWQKNKAKRSCRGWCWQGFAFDDTLTRNVFGRSQRVPAGVRPGHSHGVQSRWWRIHHDVRKTQEA